MAGLLADLDLALRELIAPVERDAAAWGRAPAGKWSVGQHVEHVGHILAMGATGFEKAADDLLRGDLGRRPWRDPIQALAVWVLTTRYPKGAKSPKPALPSPTPDRDQALASIARGAVRHRALTERLMPEQIDRLWIRNPYAPKLRWHYTFAEGLKVQAGHARHHARAVREAAG